MRAPPSGPTTDQRGQIAEEFCSSLHSISSFPRRHYCHFSSSHRDRNSAAEIQDLSSAPQSQLEEIIDEAKFDPIDSLYWTQRDPAHWVDLHLVHLPGNAFNLLWKQQRITFREQSSCRIWFECHSIQRNFIIRTLEMCWKSFGSVLQIHLEKSQSKSGKAAARGWILSKIPWKEIENIYISIHANIYSSRRPSLSSSSVVFSSSLNRLLLNFHPSFTPSQRDDGKSLKCLCSGFRFQASRLCSQILIEPFLFKLL